MTSSGIARLHQGLKVHGSAFRAVVPGAPCNSRVNEDAGTYAGVIAVSAFPARALPHSMDPAIYQTAWVQVCGIAIRQMWVQVGIVYGYPHSTLHKHRTYRTECLLDEVITRIGVQSTGPRLVCGDWSRPSDSLQQLHRP